jgi:hypothetical protein
MDQEFEDEIDRDLLENGPGEPPFIRLAKAEQRIRELLAMNGPINQANIDLRSKVAELEAALAEAREAFGHSESERCELRAALRDTIEALGGVAAPGVSVQFLKLAPQEAAAVKSQLAEARGDAVRYRYIRTEAMIDYCTGTKRHNRISWPTIYAAAPIDGGNYRNRFDAAIDAARGKS